MSTLSPSLDKFVDELLAAQGIDGVDPEVREQLPALLARELAAFRQDYLS